MYRHDPRCDHCFRSSEPQLLLAESVGFFGSGRRSSHPDQRITQSTSDQQLFIFANPFDRRRCEVNTPYINVNARKWCNENIVAVNLWIFKAMQRTRLSGAGTVRPGFAQSFHKRQNAPLAYQPTVLTKNSS